ncbi:MAG: ABC transporter substrate-binding protein [Dehalococcoidales bacterium]|nr:MAG: ABC transporter substrate-binding protein [Dehalococcoidales bacterium]
MTKKLVWLLASCLMVISLLIASCGETESTGTVTTQGEGQTVTVGGGEEDDVSTGPGTATTVGEEQNRPQYGGRLTFPVITAPSAWNPGAVVGTGAGQSAIVLEQIFGRNWAEGAAGSGKYNFVGGVPEWGAVGGNLVESWEILGIGIWKLHVRQGVHFAYHPEFEASKLVGGREMTAEDVAYSIEWMRDTESSAGMMSEPALFSNATVERNDQWTITLNTPVNPTTGYLWMLGGGGVQYVWAKEHLDNYAESNEWYDTVGTGPYITDDYVTDVSIKYIRNDNYWDVNPVGPGQGDQLPYIDSINYQIIPDTSTRMAAFRTGKLDVFGFGMDLNAEEYAQLLKTNPEVESVEVIMDPMKLCGRVDLPEDPYSNLKVRRAIMLAIDHPSIVNDFYEGKAELLDTPARKWYPSIYTPLEEYSPEVQEYYGYNVEKAKQLMAEAGYPDGFKKKVVFVNNPASEEASAILKAYLAEIGIELDLQPLESGIFMGMFWGGDIQDWIINNWPGGNGAFFVRYSMGYFRGPNVFNTAHVNNPIGSEPVIEKAFEEQAAAVMVDYPKADEVTKAAYKYCVEQAYLIPMPAPYGYRVWQPWLKNYYGTNDMKFWLRWAWLDQDLKEEMTR